MPRFLAQSIVLSSALVVASFASAHAAPKPRGDRALAARAAATPDGKAAAPAGVGSSNTTTADPPVPRPDVAPCVSKLFTASTFAAYAPQTFSYRPPAACPGPYSEIVFNGDFRVSAGIQFDRTASVEIANVPLFFGTTAEPGSKLSPSWHVERNVTDDAKLLAHPQAGEVDIFNIVDSTYTGVITGTAYLQFYPATKRSPVATPDLVLPVPNVAGGPQHLPTGQSVLSATYTLPRNVERAYLDVYAQSQQTDEQYFLCAPSSVAAEFFTCPDTAFRETEIRIDGRPAGAAPVYPWIFTGGLDPYLWFPIPGVQTLDFKPYRVDLTPFAAILANGVSHTVAFSVDNADNYFAGFATLYVYVDHGSRRVNGALTRDTLNGTPVPIVHSDLSGTPPAVDGTIRVTNARDYTIDGYVDTSHGRVTTSLHSTLDFTNYQRYSDESDTTGDVAATQTTTAKTVVLTRNALGIAALHEDAVSFPVFVSLATVLDATVSGFQKAKVHQHFSYAQADLDARGFRASFSNNDVSSADTLLVTNGGISGNAGQRSAQIYDAFDTTGYCFTKSIAAANNVLVRDEHASCDPKAAARALRTLRL